MRRGSRPPTRVGACHAGPLMAEEGTKSFVLRAAPPSGIAAPKRVIVASARGLSRADYTEPQIEAALGPV